MGISIIAAIGKNRELGKNGKLLWHIKEDLQNFKSLTMDHHVIMGRKTYESIRSQCKGTFLPGRHSIVLTTQNDFICDCQKASNLSDAINLAKGDNEIFIIGGGTVYAEALYMTETIYLTEVDYRGEADTFFPDISMYNWFLKDIEEHDGWRFMELKRVF